MGSIEGSCEKVARHLEQIANSYERRHQALVSLAMAAQYGHLSLATALMQRENVRPDQIIGEHPSRRWQNPELWHIVCKRAPVHFAVIHNQLKILKLFCQKSLICHHRDKRWGYVIGAVNCAVMKSRPKTGIQE